jgi:hypothetical protein
MTQRFVAVLLLAGSGLAQTADRKEVPVSSNVLARYVGNGSPMRPLRSTRGSRSKPQRPGVRPQSARRSGRYSPAT